LKFKEKLNRINAFVTMPASLSDQNNQPQGPAHKLKKILPFFSASRDHALGWGEEIRLEVEAWPSATTPGPFQTKQPPYHGCYLRNSTVNQEASNETVITNDLAYSAVNVTGD
jgi:hypothetical protein